MKRCSKCKTDKKLSEYYKCSSRYDGVQSCCKDCQKIWNKAWELKNWDRRKKEKAEYEKANREKRNTRRTELWAANPEQHRKYVNDYRLRHGDKYKERVAKYQREKRATDINFCIAGRLRSRIKSALKRDSKKAASSERLLGCSLEELRIRLAGQFTKDMTWEKFMKGEIHIDHIKPCSAFNLVNPEEQKECFNFKNLQPLWAKDNFIKNNIFK